MRLYPKGCRNWGRYNEKVKRSQKITSLKHGGGGLGDCFTIEKKLAISFPFGSEISGQISLPLFKIFGKWHMSTMKNCALAVKVCQNFKQLKPKIR